MVHATTVLKKFAITGTTSKTYTIIKDNNKNILIQQLMKSYNIFQYLLRKIWRFFKHHTGYLKSPVGTKFQIGSKHYVIKPKSKDMTATFKLFYKSEEKISKIQFGFCKITNQ